MHTAIHNSKKLTKTFLLEVNKDEEKEKSESNLHQKKLNIINEGDNALQRRWIML